MPIPINGGGTSSQLSLGSVWSSLAAWCRDKASDFASVPVLGSLLNSAFTGLAEGFDRADEFTTTFATYYAKLAAAVEEIQSGEGLIEALLDYDPRLAALLTNPLGYVEELSGIDFEFLQLALSGDFEGALDYVLQGTISFMSGLSREFEDAVESIMQGNQYIYWLVTDPPRMFSEIIQKWFPGLNQFLVGNDAWYIDWTYEIAQGLMQLPESVRRELGKALFGLIDWGLEAGAEALMAILEAILKWIDDNTPDFKAMSYAIAERVLKYFLEGAD